MPTPPLKNWSTFKNSSLWQKRSGKDCYHVFNIHRVAQKVKQRQQSNEDSHKVEVREKTVRKRSTIKMKIDATEIVEMKGF